MSAGVEKKDRDSLGQEIRRLAHFLEMKTKTADPSGGQELLTGLKELLSEWERRGYELGPDKIWAKGMIDRFTIWDRRDGEIQLDPVVHDPSISVEEIPALLRERRSIRFWKMKKVPRELITKVVEAATYAPSAFNRMPWRFWTLENDPGSMEKGDSTNASMIAKAPVRIYLGIDLRSYEEEHAPAMDAAMAAQNLLLAAHSLGLGACFLYQSELVSQEELRRLLGAPRHYYLFCVILMGYPDESPTAPARMEAGKVLTFTD